MELMGSSNIVTTFDGKEIERTKARRIKGQFYEIGVSCFRIKEDDGSFQWHRINNGKIAKNGETGKYERIEVLNARGFERGIMDESQEIVYMIPDEFSNVFLKEKLTEPHLGALRCANAKLAEKLGYKENWSDGFYYNTSGITAAALKSMQTKRVVKYETALVHNANEKSTFYQDIVAGYNACKKSITVAPEAIKLASLFGKYTFGIEFETSTGHIPKNRLYHLGIVPLRDGSIGGHEYTTIPLEGAIGIQTVRNACEILSERCEVNKTCSYHIHFGGFDRSYMNLLALYKVCEAVQDSFYDLVCSYKKDPVHRAKLEKNYCKPLPDLDIKYSELFTVKGDLIPEAVEREFNKIFFFFSGDTKTMDAKWNLNTGYHPQDPQNSQKWNIPARYSIFNFVPLIFSKSKTWESRLHHGTLNFTKIINWMLINSAILSFTEKNALNILKDDTPVTLPYILSGYATNFDYEKGKEDEYGKRISEYLLAYIISRKKIFNDYEKIGEHIPVEEYKKDSQYSFVYKGFTTAF